MTETPHGSHRVQAEPDRISTPRVVAVGVASLLLFFVASLVTVRAMARQKAEILSTGPAGWPAEVGTRKIGLLEQRMFPVATEPAEVKRAQLRWLESWGWVDRKTSAVHMPIEEAMDRVARGERP